MYVYLTKFENYPHLVKIGKSVNPENRTRSLELAHGKSISSEHFYVGKDCSRIESFLHRTFNSHNDVATPIGDGCTEFFSDVVLEEARMYLEKFKEQDITKMNLHALEALLIKERKYCNWLIGRLLGYKLSKESCTGQPYEMFCGFWDCQNMALTSTIGFSLDEIAERFASNLKLKRFTTKARVLLAISLFDKGTPHMRHLKQLIAECPEYLCKR